MYCLAAKFREWLKGKSRL